MSFLSPPNAATPGLGGDQGLRGGSREKAAESSVTRKICRAGSERGNNLGVALPTLITQMFEALGCSSSGTELLQLGVLSTAPEHRS